MIGAAIAAREAAIARVVEAQAWLDEHGGTYSAYIERYGHSTDPHHYGDGAEHIYAADVAAVAIAEAEAHEAVRKVHEIERLPRCGRCGEVSHPGLCWFDPR